MTQTINQSTNQPINQSTNQPINQSINQPSNQSINPSIHQSINPSIHQSINQSINQSIHQSINPSIHQSINPSIHQSINPSIHPSTNQSDQSFSCLVTSFAAEAIATASGKTAIGKKKRDIGGPWKGPTKCLHGLCVPLKHPLKKRLLAWLPSSKLLPWCLKPPKRNIAYLSHTSCFPKSVRRLCNTEHFDVFDLTQTCPHTS